MSTLRLKSKSDIKRFFKILAEESVKEARSQVFTDPAAERLSIQTKLDDQAYGSIKEEEEEESEEDILSQASDDISDEVEDADADIEADIEASSDASSDIEQVSLDSIREKIKAMRSGLSVDDSAVQNPMRSYFDLLSDPERKALYAFIDALAGIMTGQSSAETAPDPSEPPYNVKMTSNAEEESAEPEVDEEIEDDLEVEEEISDEETPKEKTVPIQVGSVQESASVERIRNKVKKLLGRS